MEYDYPRGAVPGPPIPRSWSGLFGHEQDRNTFSFRREALSLIIAHLPWSFGSSDLQPRAPADGVTVPPLAQLALRVLLAACPDAAALRAALPGYMRRDALRFTAVHAPLTVMKLYTLCAPDGNADGELFVVGPQATLSRDALLGMTPALVAFHEAEEDEEEWGPEGGSDGGRDNEAGEDPAEGRSEEGSADRSTSSARSGDREEEADTSWDVASDASYDETVPMHTLVVLNAVVSQTVLFVFPPTLTRLALLALPIATNVHRLPRICPLLEVLDLSYNPWLNRPLGGGRTSSTESTLERIEWAKWASLRVLGLRECNVSADVINKVNKGRWDEVEVIGVDGGSLALVAGMQHLRLND